MMSIIEHFSDFLGGDQAFYRDKWSIKCGTVSGENKSIMYKGLDFKTFPSTTILIIKYGPLNAPFWANYIYKNIIDSCQTIKQN